MKLPRPAGRSAHFESGAQKGSDDLSPDKTMSASYKDTSHRPYTRWKDLSGTPNYSPSNPTPVSTALLA